MLTRTFSALILLPLAIGLIWLGGMPFYVVLGLLLIIAAREINQLLRQGSHPHQAPFAFSAALVVVAGVDILLPGSALLRPGVTLILVVSLIWHCGIARWNQRSIGRCQLPAGCILDWLVHILFCCANYRMASAGCCSH